MNGLCTTCQVYFPMPPDFGDGVPYACPQCNALLVPMQEPPAPAPEPTPPPPAETAPAEPAPPPPAATAPPPPETAAAPPPPATTAPPPAAETAAAPPPPDDVATEEVTLPPVTPLDPPPNPAPPPPAAETAAAAPAAGAEAPVSLTAKEDEPESITLITAVPDEVKEIMAQKAAAAGGGAAAPSVGAGPSGPMPDAGTPKASVLWFHPKTSPEVEMARSRRLAEEAAGPVSSSFSMSGAGNGVAVEDLSGLAIPEAAPEAPAAEPVVDRMASTVDTRPPQEGAAADAGPQLVDAADIVEVPAAEESSAYVQTGGTPDEIPGAKPKAAAAASTAAETATSTPPGTKPAKSTVRPKITTATVKPIKQGGMGKWAAIILLLGVLGGGAFVAIAMPELLPASIREALHGPATGAGTEAGGTTVVEGEGEAAGTDPEAGTEAEAGGDATEAVAEGGDEAAAQTGDETEAGGDDTGEGAEAVAEGSDTAGGGDEAAGDDAAETGDEAVAGAGDPAEGAASADTGDEAEAAPAANDRRVAAADRRGRRGGRRGAREGRRGRTGRTGTARETARTTRTGTATASGTGTTTAARTETPPPAADDPKAKAKDHVRAGNSFLKQGKVDQAITQYEKAILLDGRSASAHRGLGVAYASLGRAREAVREYELYLKLAPKARDAAQVKQIVDQYYAAQKGK